MAGWYEETFRDSMRFSVRVHATLHRERTDFQTIEVLQTPFFGRTLVLDGLFMTSERDEYFYHEMISHPSLCMASSPKRVLVIGGGDGGTVREVLRHPEVERVTMVEIDRRVVEVCKEHLPDIGTAWNDPRLEVRFEDGVAFVAETPPASFDVVLLDGSDPVGPAEGLFDKTFYSNVRRVLSPSGVFGLQSESPILMEEVFRQVQHTLAEVFGSVRPYFGTVPLYGASTWSWTVAAAEPFPMDMDRLKRLEPDLRYLNVDVARGMFAVPTDLRRLLSRD